MARRFWIDAAGPLVLLAATACSPVENPVSARHLAGDYTREHRVWVFHGNEPVEVDVVDHLLVTPVDPDSLRFQLEVFADDGKVCRLAGLARGSDRGLFAYPGSDVDGSCELGLQPGEELITVTDPESRCSRTHCGQPGVFDRVSFRRGAKSEKGEQNEWNWLSLD